MMEKMGNMGMGGMMMDRSAQPGGGAGETKMDAPPMEMKMDGR
jgi:hypothetical protein